MTPDTTVQADGGAQPRHAVASAIRPATIADVPSIAALALRPFAASGWSAVTDFDPPSMLDTLNRMIASPAAVLIVAEVDALVIGFAGAAIAPAFWNHSVLTAQECFRFALPAYGPDAERALGIALRLALAERGAVIAAPVSGDNKGGAQCLYSE